MPTTFHATQNEATGALASEYRAGDGVMVLGSGEGSRFGTPSPSSPIWITARAGSNGTGAVLGHWQATGRTGNTLTGVTVAPGYTDLTLALRTWVGILWAAEHVDEIHDAINAAESALTAHTGIVAGNPHGTTAAQVGAYTSGEVDTRLAAKADASALTAHTGIVAGNPHGTTASQVGAYTSGEVDTRLTAKADASALASYALLAGATFTGAITAPTVYGSAASAGNLVLRGTSHGTAGYVFLNSGDTYVDPTGTIVIRDVARPTPSTSILTPSTITVIADPSYPTGNRETVVSFHGGYNDATSYQLERARLVTDNPFDTYSSSRFRVLTCPLPSDPAMSDSLRCGAGVVVMSALTTLTTDRNRLMFNGSIQPILDETGGASKLKFRVKSSAGALGWSELPIVWD
jgi:hypothetical protein